MKRRNTLTVSAAVLTVAVVASIQHASHHNSMLPSSATMKDGGLVHISQSINGGLIHLSYAYPLVKVGRSVDMKATTLIEDAENHWGVEYVQAVNDMCGLDDSLADQHGKIYSMILTPVEMFQDRRYVSLSVLASYNFAKGIYQHSYYTVNIDLPSNRIATLSSIVSTKQMTREILTTVQRSIMSKYGPPTQGNPYGFTQIESYSGFHIIPDGLDFEYLSCTVAACGSGPVTIFVPFSEVPSIRPLIAPGNLKHFK